MTAESSNIIIARLTSQLSIELEKLRQAAIKRDGEQMEQIILNKEELFKQLRTLIKTDNERKHWAAESACSKQKTNLLCFTFI